MAATDPARAWAWAASLSPATHLGGLFALAVLLRLIGVDYGYFHGDERVNEAARALAGQIVPAQHFYPPLFNYLNAVVFAVLYVIGRAIPLWHSLAEFRAQYFADPTAFYIAARIATAAMTAVIAPLFYLIARELRLSHGAALVAGLMGALLPASVFLAHIAKSDMPLATSGVLLLYLLLLRHRTAEAPKLDLWVGVAIVLGVSFKHSFVMFLAPLLLFHAAILVASAGLGGAVRSLLRSGLLALALWPILNIGTVLDFARFLEFQEVQAIMSVRDDSFADAARTWLGLAANPAEGLTWAGLGLALVFPVVVLAARRPGRAEAVALSGWAATLLGTAIVLATVGTRQHSGLWILYFTLLQLFAGLALALLLDQRAWALRAVGAGASLAAILASLWGASISLRQAIAPPIEAEVTAFVADHFADRRIMTSVALARKQHPEALAATRARTEALAAKYGIEMPEEAPERAVDPRPGPPLYHLPMPGVMFGLETATDEEIKDVVQPHAWPLQPQEWTLAYWFGRGVDGFVLGDLEYYRTESPSEAFRSFHTEVAETCTLLRRFEPTKPLFIEPEVSVFDCAPVASAKPSPG